MQKLKTPTLKNTKEALLKTTYDSIDCHRSNIYLVCEIDMYQVLPKRATKSQDNATVIANVSAGLMGILGKRMAVINAPTIKDRITLKRSVRKRG
jgi:hypothetical protein